MPAPRARSPRGPRTRLDAPPDVRPSSAARRALEAWLASARVTSTAAPASVASDAARLATAARPVLFRGLRHPARAAPPPRAARGWIRLTQGSHRARSPQPRRPADGDPARRQRRLDREASAQIGEPGATGEGRRAAPSESRRTATSRTPPPAAASRSLNRRSIVGASARCGSARRRRASRVRQPATSTASAPTT